MLPLAQKAFGNRDIILHPRHTQHQKERKEREKAQYQLLRTKFSPIQDNLGNILTKTEKLNESQSVIIEGLKEKTFYTTRHDIISPNNNMRKLFTNITCIGKPTDIIVTQAPPIDFNSPMQMNTHSRSDDTNRVKFVFSVNGKDVEKKVNNISGELYILKEGETLEPADEEIMKDLVFGDNEEERNAYLQKGGKRKRKSMKKTKKKTKRTKKRKRQTKRR